MANRAERRSARSAAAAAGVEDTAELPGLKLGDLPADVIREHGDALARTDSWRVEPEQQHALEREAELGTLRLTLASLTTSHEQLENSLRGLTMNVRDLEERLGARTAELTSKERALTAREVQLGELQQELATARARASAAEAQRLAQADEDESRRQALLGQLQARQDVLVARERELADLRQAREREATAHHALLEENERRAQALASAEQQLTALQARVSELQAELADAGQQRAGLQVRYLASEQLGAELQQSLLALQASHAELQTQHQRTLTGSEDLRRDLGEQMDTLRGLQQQLEQLEADRERSSNELRIAEERLRAADTELRNRDQRIEHLAASEGALRSRSEQLARQLAERDALIRRLDNEAETSAAALGKIQSNMTRLDKDEGAVPRDLVARLLIRNDGNTEIVQVLGRRTLIGRGVDCQLQIDAEFVSRRHALVVASPDETVIEDLNSTNGVFVNGIRVSRRRLVEGDQVMVGKTLFRYVVKPVADRGS